MATSQNTTTLKRAIKGVKGFIPRDILERFFEKIVIDESGCWLWNGKRYERQYASIESNGKRIKAHLFSWEIHNKLPFPAGMLGCHTCDVTSCVNPEHIFPGTMTDNLNDAVSKGRLTSPMVHKTHCPQGHQYLPENKNATGRFCRICRVAHNRRWRDKQKAQRGKGVSV